MSDRSSMNDPVDKEISLTPGDANAIVSKGEARTIMREAITIPNLGPLKDVTLSEVKPFSVFIGESGSGKSVLLKVLALFRRLPLRLAKAALLGSAVPNNILLLEMLAESDLGYFVKDDTILEYTATCSDNTQLLFSFKLDQTGIRPADYDFTGLIPPRSLYIPETRAALPMYLTRGVVQRGEDFGHYFHQVLNAFLVAISCKPVTEIPFLGVNFEYDKSGVSPTYNFVGRSSDQPFTIPYTTGSSGMQSVTPLLAIVRHFAQRSAQEADIVTENDLALVPPFEVPASRTRLDLHIEEPELSLYPSAQCDLIDTLVRQCFVENKPQVSTSMATHSPYILNHLNLLIKAHDTNNTEFTNGARLDFDNIAAYHVADGGIEDLKMLNHRLVDTNALSDTIDVIYNRYEELK